jgi:ABC-type Fe3+-siderophore transport system permease subunit
MTRIWGAEPIVFVSVFLKLLEEIAFSFLVSGVGAPFLIYAIWKGRQP